MSEYRLATGFTKRLEYLISCIQTASYGQSEGSFNPRIDDRIPKGVRQLSLGDRMFLNFDFKLLAGPFIVSDPLPHIVFDDHRGCWHKVNVQKTPIEFQPVWMYNQDKKVWCIFFDPLLCSQVNYCLFTFLPKELRLLPHIDLISDELGERLWEYLEDQGSSFADFLQRHSTKLGFHQPVYSAANIRRTDSLPASRTAATFTGRYKADTGAMVRSKSEKLIADYLLKHGFLFQYEKPLLLEGNVIHPDFFLVNSQIVIEHLGWLDRSEQYRQNWEWRKNLYDRNHITYITTTESDIPELEKNLLTKLAQKGCKPSE
jgi:hypothetical protein